MKTVLRPLIALALLGTGSVVGWRMFWSKSAFVPVAVQAAAGTTNPGASRPGEPASSPLASREVPANSLAVVPSAREMTSALVAQIERAFNSPDEMEWESILNRLYPSLVAQDRVAAGRLLETLPAGDHRDQLLRRLARAWAAVDFAGAVGWIGSLSSAADQKTAFEDACFGAAETNPAEAIHAWETFNFGVDDHVLENLVQNWAGQDIEAARAWVSGRAPGPQRDQVVARIAFVLAKTKPADAANFATRGIPPGPAQTEAVISVLQTWAQHDLAGATAWAAGFTEEPLRQRAIGELAGIGRDSP